MILYPAKKQVFVHFLIQGGRVLGILFLFAMIDMYDHLAKNKCIIANPLLSYTTSCGPRKSIISIQQCQKFFTAQLGRYPSAHH